MKCPECSADTRLCQCAQAERDSRENSLGYHYQRGYEAGHAADAFVIEDLGLTAHRDAYSRGYENGARDRMREASEAKSKAALLTKTYQAWAKREAAHAEEVKRLTEALIEERARVSNLRERIAGKDAAIDHLRGERDVARADYRDLRLRVLQAPAAPESEDTKDAERYRMLQSLDYPEACRMMQYLKHDADRMLDERIEQAASTRAALKRMGDAVRAEYAEREAAQNG